MASRLPCLAICRTDSHCKKLEMMPTEFVFEGQQRDGSTFCIPDMKIAKTTDEQPVSKAKAKAKATKKRAKGGEPAGDDEDKAEEKAEEKAGEKAEEEA